MRIALCDDDEKELQELRELIGQVRPEDALFCYTDAGSLLKELRGGVSFDCFFLDICMPGTDGIRLAGDIRSLREEAPLVFVTNSADYSLDAFGVGACHYLIKPVDRERLAEALSRVQRTSAARQGITVLSRGQRQFLFLDEIALCESNGRVMDITLKSAAKVSCYCSCGEMQRQLSDAFLPVSRGLLVNADYVEKMYADRCVLKDGREILLSRARAKELKDAYMEYCFTHLYTPQPVA